MHVLEHALRGGRRIDAEVRTHPLVEGGRQVRDGQPLLDQLLLELEAKDDVHRVGDLVGVDADERGLHAVHVADEALLGDGL